MRARIRLCRRKWGPSSPRHSVCVLHSFIGSSKYWQFVEEKSFNIFEMSMLSELREHMVSQSHRKSLYTPSHVKNFQPEYGYQRFCFCYWCSQHLSMQDLNHPNTGFSFSLGTYLTVKINHFLKNRPPGNQTDIDDLIRFEQMINFVNAPVILMQLLWIMIEMPKTDCFIIIVFSSLMQAAQFFSACHRAFGSLVIVGVRWVSVCNSLMPILKEFWFQGNVCKVPQFSSWNRSAKIC